MLLKTIFNDILDLFFPQRCIGCGEIIGNKDFLCEHCHRRIERVDDKTRCAACGVEKDNCDCKRVIFHFSRCVAPFYNVKGGIAQTIIYAFKLNLREYNCEYLAMQMAKCIQQEYSDLKIDGVVYVPQSISSYTKRGFNQSYLLARRICELCGYPLIKGAIRFVHKGKAQHKTSGKERFLNARGKYSVKRRFDGANLLLIDDIKTTGATLDECARQLLFAGAHNVYAATAVIKQFKKGNEENGN